MDSQELCKLKGNEWDFVEQLDSCIKVDERRPAETVCKAKGEGYTYDAEKDLCLKVQSESPIAQLCSDEKPYNSYDAELEICSTYSEKIALQALCVESSGSLSADKKTCEIAGNHKSIDMLCEEKGKGYVYHEELQACLKVKTFVNASGLCLQKGSNSHFYISKTALCVKVSSKLEGESLCGSLGKTWDFDGGADECLNISDRITLLDLCDSGAPSCIWNGEKGKWDVLSGLKTEKDLCLERGVDFEYSEKEGCKNKKGETILADGTKILADGAKILPDGTTVKPSGEKILKDGTIIRPDGTKILQDGTKIKPDGTVIGPDGKVVPKDADGNVVLPNGYIVDASGNVTTPEGLVIAPDGSITYLDGTLIKADGTVVKPDGTTISPDGTTTLPSGEILLPGGESSAKGPTNGAKNKYIVAINKQQMLAKIGTRNYWKPTDEFFSGWFEWYDWWDNLDRYKPEQQVVLEKQLVCPEGFMVKQIEAQTSFFNRNLGFGEHINWMQLSCVNFSGQERYRRMGQNDPESTESGVISCPGSELATGIQMNTISAIPKNLELECASFDRSSIEKGDKNINFRATKSVTGDALFHNDKFGENRYLRTCDAYPSRNRVLAGFQYWVDNTKAEQENWIPIWFNPICSEIVKNLN